jgi:hypothetical protein
MAFRMQESNIELTLIDHVGTVEHKITDAQKHDKLLKAIENYLNWKNGLVRSFVSTSEEKIRFWEN